MTAQLLRQTAHLHLSKLAVILKAPAPEPRPRRILRRLKDLACVPGGWLHLAEAGPEPHGVDPSSQAPQDDCSTSTADRTSPPFEVGSHPEGACAGAASAPNPAVPEGSSLRSWWLASSRGSRPRAAWSRSFVASSSG